MNQNHTFIEVLHHLEQAIRDERFEDGADMLGWVVDAVRAHRPEEMSGALETRAFRGGLSNNALIDRTRILQARCQNGGGETIVDGIARDLLVLMDDLTEIGAHIPQAMTFSAD